MPAPPAIVLVVDDDAAVRSALKFALEMEGFVIRLYDGPQAVLADHGLPERGCLVVDFQMPQIDGLELVRQLRDRQVTLPAILISGRAGNLLKRRAAELGVTCVLEKPLSDAALVEGIRDALKASSAA